ncbi:MAG: hypothetical protein ACP5LW_06500 [Nitrososphaeria archaeon]
MESQSSPKWEETMRKGIVGMISGARYRHGRSYVIVSDLAKQLYCEQKVEMAYVIGEIPTESKRVGDAIHEEVLAMKPSTREQVIRGIKSGREFITEFLVFGQISGVLVAGVPDAVYFDKEKPKILIELKTIGGSILRLWEDQILQVQLYAYLME